MLNTCLPLDSLMTINLLCCEDGAIIIVCIVMYMDLANTATSSMVWSACLLFLEHAHGIL